MVATQAFGPHHLAREALPSMRTRGRGDIVMISSVATSHMSANGAPYNMGKAAMEALTFSLAEGGASLRDPRQRRRARVGGDRHGPAVARAMSGNRDMEDLRSLDAAHRSGECVSLGTYANVVLWLCSDGAGYVTGQRIEVDGGGTR